MSVKKLSNKAVADLIADLAGHDHYVLLDTSLPDQENRESLLFTKPREHLHYRAGEDRKRFFDQLQHHLEQGYYLAGWFGYEFLHDHLSIPCKGDDCMSAEIGVYNQPRALSHEENEGRELSKDSEQQKSRAYTLGNLLPSMDEHRYCQAIRRILDYIAAGDTYQVNYTFKFSFDFAGSIAGLYTDLRRSQPVPYGCCIKHGDRYVLSFSPELFFRADRQQIFARPMKGTLKRGRTVEEDANFQQMLQLDEKNRSENVMIVDLLRNDLSRLVEATGGGYVNVNSLFDVERYQTVFQMTSSIVADRHRDDRVSPEEMLKALFPCGSVTGAPKIRTMEIIDELEEQPRGVYTGAIGYFSPAGKAVFNVPIRTIVINDDKGEMGIGSGIVADSSPEDEWQECLLKAKFLTNPLPDFKLIETMLYDPQDGYLFLEDHLLRLQRSASYFNFPFHEKQVGNELEHLAASFDSAGCRRVRVTLSMEGEVHATSTECSPPESCELSDDQIDKDLTPVEIDFADESTDSTHPWLFHKTTRRNVYDNAYKKARSAGLFDVVFCNERGEVTEGCITNIIIRKDNTYYTPPLTCGLLDGVMRKQLLHKNARVGVREKTLHKADIIKADAVFICNSVRGVIPARIRSAA